jgi:hypothetical protein
MEEISLLHGVSLSSRFAWLCHHAARFFLNFDNEIQICNLFSEFSWAIRAFISECQLSESARERVAAPFPPVGLQNTTFNISLRMPNNQP